jgi:hypothetical protein
MASGGWRPAQWAALLRPSEGGSAFFVFDGEREERLLCPRIENIGSKSPVPRGLCQQESLVVHHMLVSLHRAGFPINRGRTH